MHSTVQLERERTANIPMRGRDVLDNVYNLALMPWRSSTPPSRIWNKPAQENSTRFLTNKESVDPRAK